MRSVRPWIDFGLVKDTADPSTSLTIAGALAGTPLYASPEAIRSTGAVEPRSDLYSLGATAYYLLTGLHVFDGDTVLEVTTQHLSAEPESLAARSGLDISADLEAVILSCLAKSPEDRPSSARDLRALLTACADHGHWGEEDARAWWEEHEHDLPVPGHEALPEGLIELTIDMDHRLD